MLGKELGEEDLPVFMVLDVMRYRRPNVFPKEIEDMMIRYNPYYLYDIFVKMDEGVFHAFLHPKNYFRLLRGWIEIGSRIAIRNVSGDVIEDLEVLEEGDAGEETFINNFKRNEFEELPQPLYNPEAFYFPFLSDEDYIKWDPSWEAELRSAEDMQGPREKKIEAADLEPPGQEEAASLVQSQAKRNKRTKAPSSGAYRHTKHNTITGTVVLKSKLFFYSQRALKFPCLFFFVLKVGEDFVKVLVWNRCVKRFFCVQEGDGVLLRGFKIKRRRGNLLLADRTNTDSDTRYVEIPEISVNVSSPRGEIFRCPLSEEPAAGEDPEFTTVRGPVEYVSSLLRWRDRAEANEAAKIKEFVYVRVGDTRIKLYNNASPEFHGITNGASVEIRHLRKVSLGEFVFYISSVYTTVYREGAPHRKINHDAHMIEYPPQSPSRRKCVAGAVGYIPVSFKKMAEYDLSSRRGLGPLAVGGCEIDYDSIDALYIRKESVYYSKIMSIEEVLFEIRNHLFIDELKRFVFHGRILGVKHGLESTYDDGSDLDITYSHIQIEEGVSSRRDMVQDSVTLLVESAEEGRAAPSRIEMQIFRNYFAGGSSLRGALRDFFKGPLDGDVDLFVYASSFIDSPFYFVMDSVRVKEDVVVNVGIAALL